MEAITGILNAVGDGISITAKANEPPPGPLKLISLLQLQVDSLSTINTAIITYNSPSTSAKVLWPMSAIALVLEIMKVNDSMTVPRYSTQKAWKVASMVVKVFGNCRFLYNAFAHPSIENNVFGTIKAGKPLLASMLIGKPTPVRIAALCAADITVGSGLCALDYVKADK